jgi:FHA domain
MRDVLRAVDGLAADVVFELGERVTLGRSAVSDVQLAHPDVSRFHALIERDPKGHSFITDLASKSGTFVDGTKVHRAMLRRGTVVEICHFRLRYDTVDDAVRSTRPAKITGTVVVSQTRESPRMSEAEEKTSPGAVPRPRTSTSTAAVRPSRHLELCSEDGDLLELARAVMEYRVLAFDERDDRCGPQAGRLRVLRARLDVPPTADMENSRRIHQRFARSGPVLLGVVSGTETHVRPANIIGLGAGGARVRIDDPPPTDSQCWLLVATGASERSAIGFPARVAWSDPRRSGVGLAFIGRPIEGSDLLPPSPGFRGR